MNLELVIVCLAVGAGTYLFRYLPTRTAALGGRRPGLFKGRAGAFVASVGVAAVAALLAASVADLPGMSPTAGRLPFGPPALAAAAGFLTVIVTFVWRRSVALSTLAGAAVYGVAWWAFA